MMASVALYIILTRKINEVHMLLSVHALWDYVSIRQNALIDHVIGIVQIS